MLNILTPYGNHYKVDSNGNIIRTDIKGFKPSKQWKFMGLSHVKRPDFIPLSSLTPKFFDGFNTCWKNGNPQWTVRDWDHGTIREWGNTKYHGVERIWFD